MSDLISRKAAIEKIVSLKRERNPLTETDRAMNYILEVAESCLYYLPSVKPVVKDTNVPYSDTISRQAAIEAFDCTNELIVGGEANAQNVVNYINKVVGKIKDLPSAQQEQQWIPCSERLPNKAYGQYWVCTDTGYQCQCRWTDDVYGLGPSGEWTWKIFDIPQYSHAIAWMPLPEPYKGEIYD